MQFLTSFSTSKATSGGGGSSNKGILSLSSNSVIGESKGPPLIERLKGNILLVSTNMHRYTSFGSGWSDAGSIIRLVQIYILILCTRYTDFWDSTDASNAIVTIAEIPFSFTFEPQNVLYRDIIIFVIFAFYIIEVIILFVVLMKSPTTTSLPNSLIYWLCLYYSFFLPITEIPVANNFGYLFYVIIFTEDKSIINIAALVFGLVTFVMMIFFHYFSFAIYRCSPTVNFRGLMRPWPRHEMHVANYDVAIIATAFLEGLIDTNEKIQRIVFLIIMMILTNPFIIYLFLTRPVYQDVEDSVHISVVLIVGFASAIFLLINTFIKFLDPSTHFTIMLFAAIIFYLVFSFISHKKVTKIIARLYSIYKSSRPVLPPLTPVVFSNPLSNQITLSQEAYSVMQRFSSLGINDEDTFNYFLAVGAKMKVPSVRNIDFIKWGLNYFTAPTTLLASSQLIQHFNGCARSETVILQKMRETTSYPIMYIALIQHLEGLHEDLMLDKPVLLQALCAKANAAITRCKRSIALFWGCVLRRSNNGIREALCRVRNTITESDPHFEELLRCYPHTKQAITLYLSYLTEVKGSFEECNNYINRLSTYFVARQGEIEIDEDATTDFLSSLLNDDTNTYNKYINDLPIYAEHERQSLASGSNVTNIMLSVVVLAIAFLIIGFTSIIVWYLLSINDFPLYLEMVYSMNKVLSVVASATSAARRMCFFAKGYLTSQPTTCKETIENLNVTIKTLIDASNTFPLLVQNFLISVASKQEIVDVMNHFSTSVSFNEKTIVMGLSQILKTYGDALRNIAILVPEQLSNMPIQLLDANTITKYIIICNSGEMKFITQNIGALTDLCDVFIGSFIESVGSTVKEMLRIFMMMIYIIPASYFVLFVVFVIISAVVAIKESKFRATLFLSLPEQVASGFFRADNGRPIKKAGYEPVFQTNTPAGRVETENTKDKIQLIEKLHEFSAVDQVSHDTGIRVYVGSAITFLILASISMLGLLFYGHETSRTFDQQTTLTCYSMMRNIATEFSAFFAEEVMVNSKNDPNISIINDTTSLFFMKKYLDLAVDVHNIIIFGKLEGINFKRYSAFKNLFLEFDPGEKDFNNLRHSIMLTHNLSYPSFGFDLRTRLFYTTLWGMHIKLSNNHTKFIIDDETWHAIDHFELAHLQDILIQASSIYLDGVQSSMNQSLIYSIVIFIVALIVTLFIFLGFVIPAIIRLKRFFVCGVRLLCQVPPHVFQRSLFVNKWLKGQITRSNFMELETHFNRTISPALQNKLIQELPESIFLFDLQGNYVQSQSFDTTNLEDKSMKSILPLIVDATHDFQLLSVAEAVLTKIGETKDIVQPVIYNAKSVDGTPIRLTFVGVSAAEAGIISKDSVLRQFYSYLAIITKDITQEANHEQQYLSQKERTLNLLKGTILPQLADRVHDGERRISFTASVGSVLIMEICNYTKLVSQIDLAALPSTLQQLHLLISEELNNFPNVSLISFTRGVATFAVGLFNDEQNGRTEAIDSVQFTIALSQKIAQFAETVGQEIIVRFAVCTGSPIYYKLLLDLAPVSFVAGEISAMTQTLIKRGKPWQLLFERTTYECIYGLNLEAQHVGEYEFNDKHTTLYSIALSSHPMPAH